MTRHDSEKAMFLFLATCAAVSGSVFIATDNAIAFGFMLWFALLSSGVWHRDS